MARILHIWQKIENFQAFENANERYLNAESVQFYREIYSRSVEKAQVHISYKVNKRLKYMRLHSDIFTFLLHSP